MAFRATLNFAGKEFDVLDCTYSLKRDVDSKGRPSSNIYGGQIRLHVESTDDTSILENMTNQFKPHSGSIVFKKGDEEAKMKELTWENGYRIYRKHRHCRLAADDYHFCRIGSGNQDWWRTI